jgi:hypothetical protein
MVVWDPQTRNAKTITRYVLERSAGGSNHIKQRLVSPNMEWTSWGRLWCDESRRPEGLSTIYKQCFPSLDKIGFIDHRVTWSSLHCRTMYRVQTSLASLLSLTTAIVGSVVHHDDSFQPDHILRETAQNYKEACTTRYSVLVNGTSPGPELRLREGQVSWIRVYNDMKDDNTTIVSWRKWSVEDLLLIEMIALARPYCVYGSFLRWHPSR